MIQASTMQTPQYQTLVPQPNYNAVKIDINNPQVNTPGSQSQMTATPVYGSVPVASVYEVPQQSIYQPAALQEAPSVPPPVIIQQPSINQTTAPAAPAAPVVEAPAAPPQAVEVKTPETVTPKVDLNAFLSKLTSNDYKEQAIGMQSIVEMVKNSPEIAAELLDVKIIDALLGIMNKDSSALEGPTPKQLQIREKIMNGKKVSEADAAEANKISPMELAERNKLLAIFTVVTLQKLYGSEIERIYKNVEPLTNLPGAAAIVEQIKNNPNPIVRAVSIQALDQIKRSEYKQDLKTLFTVAKNDKDPYVKKAAENALKELEQIPNPSTEEPKTA